MPLEGEMAHCGGDICELCVLLAKSLSRVSFLFPPERTLVINGYTNGKASLHVLHPSRVSSPIVFFSTVIFAR